jgi:hypothetical protein
MVYILIESNMYDPTTSELVGYRLASDGFRDGFGVYIGEVNSRCLVMLNVGFVTLFDQHSIYEPFQWIEVKANERRHQTRNALSYKRKVDGV